MPRPAHILEFRYSDGSGGGPEKTILLGSACSDQSRFAVTVCYIRDLRDPDFDIDQRAGQLGLDYTELHQRHGLDLTLWGAARRLVRQRRIDLVHAHDYKTNLIALYLRQVEGVVPLSTVHGWTGHTWRERYLYYPVDKRVLAHFPRLLAVSSDIRLELVRAGARPSRVQTLLNGIDHRSCRRDPTRVLAARARFGLADGDVAIGSVGRLEPQKRFDLLLEAFAASRSDRPELRLLIAGEGSSRNALLAKAEQLHLGSSCRLLGHCTDVPELHHALNLFVQSSSYEGTPNVVLEAMAFETPIVATAVGGTVELIRHETDGLLIAPLDAAALRTAIHKALVDPVATRKRVAAARARVESDLSFDARTRTLEAVYDDLLSRRARTSCARMS